MEDFDSSDEDPMMREPLDAVSNDNTNSNAAADASWQLRELREKSASLAFMLAQRDEENSALQAIIDAANNIGVSPDPRDAKIIQLSKKARALTVSVERERTRASKLQTELKQAKETAALLQSTTTTNNTNTTTTNNNSAKSSTRKPPADVTPTPAATESLEKWKEKYNQMRDMERAAKAECQQLRSALMRETGLTDIDACVASTSSADDGGWRGRAQQILVLKEKVRELKAKLRSAEAASAAAMQPDGAVGDSITGSLSSIDNTNTSANNNNARERRKEMERALTELAEARAEAAAARSRAEAANTRKMLLENEVRSLREKVEVVLEKAGNDDRLIAALRAELARRQQQQQQLSQPQTQQQQQQQQSESAGVGRREQQSGTVGSVGGMEAGKEKRAVGNDSSSNSATSRKDEVISDLQVKCREQQARIERQEKLILQLQQAYARRE